METFVIRRPTDEENYSNAMFKTFSMVNSQNNQNPPEKKEKKSKKEEQRTQMEFLKAIEKKIDDLPGIILSKLREESAIDNGKNTNKSYLGDASTMASEKSLFLSKENPAPVSIMGKRRNLIEEKLTLEFLKFF